MPVIAHRRANELRGGRRRLSAGAIAGMGGSSSSSSSPPGAKGAPLAASLPASPSLRCDPRAAARARGELAAATAPDGQSADGHGGGPDRALWGSDDMHSAAADWWEADDSDNDSGGGGGDDNGASAGTAAGGSGSGSGSGSGGGGGASLAGSEPLPTPEQLIFTQSWSTWPTPCHDLYSGSQFVGTQSNGMRSYSVTVALKYVDMGVPELCGHFTIRGLTSELPMLTTYFDAQIVGTGGSSFITNQWGATIDTDRCHWGLFAPFQKYSARFDRKDFAYRLGPADRYVFMRWKERFVVPNYRLSRINGASYEGFYYVCYDKEHSLITGYYCHKDSDSNQRLRLTHARQTSFSHFELA
ncbi:hypothetical protein H4R18_005462 [Coemansia javaensis]|uniref:Vacuolar import and degradation protein n=1 Tax=Coemansia javaensis TaxID=2761396 RepID=A0A9W8H917_9FUNG|nr:hypothetical protein H4R18_005462 [Coemansia javaensis]